MRTHTGTGRRCEEPMHLITRGKIWRLGSSNKLPSPRRGGGDGTFAVIILHAGSLHLVYVAEKPAFIVSEVEGDLQ